MKTKYQVHHVDSEYLLKWQKTIDLVAQIFEVPAALIMRVHPTEIEVLLSSHTEGNPYKEGEKADLNTGLYCETVMATRSRLLVPNALKDKVWMNNPDIELGMISYFGIPLFWPDGSVFGTICVLDSKTREYSEMYQSLLWEFKNIIELGFAQSRENERQLQIIFDNTPVIMMLINENYEVMQINNAGISASGRNIHEIIHCRIGDVYRCGNSLARGCGKSDHCSECILGRTIGKTFAFKQSFNRIEGSMELNRQHKNLLISTSLVSGTSPSIALVTIDDITSIKQMEKRLLQKQKMEAIGTLAGGIAHDFNNILTPIVGYSEMLKGDIPENSSMQSPLTDIFNAGMRGKKLVKQILSTSKKNVIKKKVLTLQPLIAESLEMIRSTIPPGINLQQKNKPTCGSVNADPTQISQIIMNLIINALHSMEEMKKGTLAISLDEIAISEPQDDFPDLQTGNYARLKISDTGTGIEKKLLDKIFNPYFTTKESGKGSGLGLAIVLGIIQENKGEIQIESTPGQGTDVSVYLPLVKLHKESLGSATKSHPPVQGGKERILLIDDEIMIARMEEQMLQRLGYEVVAHTNAEEALEDFREQKEHFDLVITDMSMPQMTGLQFSREVKEIKPGIPVIVFTGFNEKIDESKYKEMDLQGYAMKPLDKQLIAGVIRKALDL